MFFMMGVTDRQKELEHDQTVICDVCGSYGRYVVFMTCTVLSLFLIPVWKWNRRYYVRMSCCGTLYELDPEIGRVIEQGTDVQIGNEDLTLLSASHHPHKRCFNCGYETDEDFEFCPKCGQRF